MVFFGRSYCFEIWVEKQRILEQLDMAQCIASFLHLVFIFDLKFPAKAQTVCDFLQRVVADYGTDEGNNLIFFLSILTSFVWSRN
jgi:hypothetical protein